jgi:3',5'-cyclic AMP phosphodiesterase CpdA
MARYRLAHYSDIHFTLPPWRFVPRLFNKRMGGTVNYYLGGRGLRFKDVAHRIGRLLEDVDAQQVDHAVCTGDLTAISLREEFAGCAALFGHRLLDASQLTVLPGNHDRYVQEAVTGRFFEEHFANVATGDVGSYPHAKEILPGVTLVALDVARPTPITHSSGLCGDEKRARLQEMLTDASLKDRWVILALHYGLLRRHGERDRPTHGIRDDVELTTMLDLPEVHLDLVVHGHMHGSFSVRTQRRQVYCAGSATDLAHPDAGYNIYTVDTQARTVTSERRVWDVEKDCYRAAPA